MIFCLTLNPSIDTEIFVRTLAGRDVKANQISYRIAGKGINVAETLWSADQQCCSLVYAGTFDGRATLSVQHEVFPHHEPVRQNFSLFEGQELTAHIRSPFETTLCGMKPLLVSLTDRCRSEDIIVLSGAMPTLVDDPDYKQTIIFLDSLAGQIVLDTSSFDQSLLSQMALHTLKVSAREFRHTFGIEGNATLTAEFVLKAAKKINARVIVTQGSGSVLAADAHGDVFSCLIRSEYMSGRASIIGSGDSFLAGYVAALNTHVSFRECVQNGTIFGLARQANNSLSGISFDEASISNLRESVEIVEPI
jgi:1-phosphofructokinase